MPRSLESTTRRRFLGLLGGVAASTTASWLGLNFLAPRAEAAGPGTTPFSARLLEKSNFAYISPLIARSSGGAEKKLTESSCHAELWYAWLDESVVVIVSSDRWKATALARGHDRARVWIGNHGRWKGMLGTRNETFRRAPHFDARVEKVEDTTMIERLLASYEEKYPAEIASWRDRMRSGAADGSRVLLRYRPIESIDVSANRPA